MFEQFDYFWGCVYLIRFSILMLRISENYLVWSHRYTMPVACESAWNVQFPLTLTTPLSAFSSLPTHTLPLLVPPHPSLACYVFLPCTGNLAKTDKRTIHEARRTHMRKPGPMEVNKTLISNLFYTLFNLVKCESLSS